MNLKLVPADRLLPEPSILEKIKALHPESVNDIFEGFEQIAAARRAAALNSSTAKSLTESFRHGLREAVYYYFRPVQNFRDSFLTPTNPHQAAAAAMNRDWAVTGDDLRAAINDYIAQHKLTGQLDLTPRERQSLDYVARDYTQNHPRPAAPTPQ